MARRRSSASNPRVAVNGVFLDEVRTRLDYGRETGSIALMVLPVEHHRLTVDGDTVVLCTPAITALQLYYDGVLPADRDRAVELTLGSEKLGKYLVQSLRRVEMSQFGEPVLIRFVKATEEPK